MVHPNGETLHGREDVYEWYTKEIARIPLVMRELLEEYSGLPEDQVIPHISEVRDRAFDLFPYPCIGQLRFLDLKLAEHPLYSTILSRLTAGGQTFLDAGCCFGQELRKLAFDGVPPRAMYGMDLERTFLELGFELFLDRTKMADATFVAGNLLEDISFPELEGKIDIMQANSLLHLFTWDEQIIVTSKLVTFMKNKPGSIMLGRHVGAVNAGEYRGLGEGTTTYRHNVESFQRLWEEVGRKTGSKWKVDVRLDMKDIVTGVNLGQKWMEAGTRRLHFVVMRE